MNSILYFTRSKKRDEKFKSLIMDYGLTVCYKDKKEKILKNDEMLLSIKKRYVFLSFFAEASQILQEEIQKSLL